MTQATESQLSLMEGLERQEAGRNHVEWSHEYWVEQMRSVARIISRKNGFVTTDDIHRHVEQEGCFPEKNTAFTAIFRGDGWKDTGFMQSSLKTNHGRLIRKWAWKG